jgi:hypothetical protein
MHLPCPCAAFEETGGGHLQVSTWPTVQAGGRGTAEFLPTVFQGTRGDSHEALESGFTEL